MVYSFYNTIIIPLPPKKRTTMKQIFASSSLTVTENPETRPSEEELSLPDGKSIAELIDENKRTEDDSQQSNRATLS